MAVPQKETHRLYHCGRCAEQVRICRRCDRGNVYCAGACAGLRRRESLRRAGERYQLSHRGACLHAARQSAWRARQSHKVTHQGSLAPAVTLTLPALSSEAPAQVSDADTTHVEPRTQRCTALSTPHCTFCRRPLSSFARIGPLRRGP
jgi:hypothetical protein